ncbi:MAG: Serine beta-lactamase-like protein mitochondrial [Mucilaginibacter sp.]|nr:Serine beta-lactamase-like protein mitochondrial [Mucilaginibacter sp.]
MKTIMLLLGLIITVNCYAQELSPQQKNKIDHLFAAFNRKDSPGYAIGVVKGTKVLYTKGYGAANLDYQIPITPNSSFDIASVSKQFTAACIALLIMDKKLDLDMPVSKFVPELAKYKDTIRIKHLIYNTSGITDYHKLPRPDGKSWITFNYFDIDYCIKVSLSKDTLAFKPGNKWDYCNVNFMVLAKIVEKVSGLSFAEFSKKRLFIPLGMTHTLINDDNTTVIPNRVTPYNPRTKEYVDAYRKEGFKLNYEGSWIQHTRNSPHYGGSGVVSTINDLNKWSENFFTHKFGGKAFYDLMHKTLKFNHDMDNQAFGLYFGKYKNRTYVAWDGGDFGVSSQLIRFPDKKIAIVVLSNLGTGNAAGKADEIADVLIEGGLL